MLAQKLRQDALVLEIEDLLSDLREAQRRSDEPGGYYGRYGDEDDSLGPYERFVEPICDLLDRTDAVFDAGNLPLSRAAYDKLFTVFELQDDYGRGVSPSHLPTLNLTATRGRYLRSVYETEPLERRPEVLFEEMTRLQEQAWRPPLPLATLLQVTDRLLPDRDAFLTAWIALLRQQQGPTAEAQLREAIRLQGGSAALAEFARREGEQRPRAYLDWVVALRDEGKPKAAVRAAEEALRALPADMPLRAAIADHLCAAAQELRNTKKVQAGRWEAFAAWPVLPRLLDLLDATTAVKRGERLTAAEEHLAVYLQRSARRAEPTDPPGFVDQGDEHGTVSKLVLAHAHLLNAHWDAARTLASGHDVIGWGYAGNPQRIVVPAFLVLALGNDTPLPRQLASLWNWALGGSSFNYGTPSPDTDAERLGQAYQRLRQEHPLPPAQADALLSWCIEMSERRVDVIVGKKRRHSYGKAAQLIAACGEVLHAREREQEAAALGQRLRERYPRHRAFLEELMKAQGGVRRR